MSPRFFIDRPIFASVLSIVIVVVGLVAMRALPIAQFPDITPPVVQIDADYPGASAEVVANAVARPIEVQLPGIDNLLYFESTSTNDGHMTIKVTFEIGTDIDIAQVQTQNRVKLAEPQIPQEVTRQGVTVKKLSSDLLAVITLSSDDPRYDTLFLSNYATLQILDNIRRVPGIGDATVFGQQNYSMRLILNPDRMAQLQITPTDIVNIVREQNRDFPSGTIGREPALKGTLLTFPVITQGRLTEVKDFEELIIRALPDGSMVRLKDVARVELGAQSYALESRKDKKPTTFILAFLSPGANALDSISQVRQAMGEMSKNFPTGITWEIPFDTTPFIQVSIDEVVKTLIEAMILVILVVYLFLQSWRATLIPTLAVPVSLIGTFAGMYALGFSINTLTLFGMILAVGIVVDDAIVVVENVERHMALGLGPREAAKKAMEEVTGPVIAIVLVLCSVFIPVAFLGGITGELYKQFAITIAMSVTISGLVALTLSPALSAVILKPGHNEPNRFFRLFNRLFDRIRDGYSAAVAGMLKRSLLFVGIFGVVLFLSIGMFKFIPSSFLPEEDQGYFIGMVQLPDGASKQRTDEVLERLENYFHSDPRIRHTNVLSGQNFVFSTRGPNAATIFLPLKDWDERTDPQDHVKSIIGAAFGEFSKIPEALVLAFNPPPIRGLGATGGFSAQLQDPLGGDFRAFSDATQEFIAKARQEPAIGGIGTNFRVSAPRLYAKVDRERAKALGVSISDIFDTMQAYFGNFYINDFIKSGRVYRVQTEADPEYRSSPDDIANLYVRAQNGKMIPLSAVITTEFTSGPDPVTHFNGLNSALLVGSAAPGYSSGQTLDALERLAKEVLEPKGYQLDWSGISYQERKGSSQSLLVFGIGLLMVFLVLAAQYESWSIPFVVNLAVPFGIFGALVAVWLRGLTNDIYFQIGLVTLIGLSAKNAILITEFVHQRYKEGVPLIQAAVEGSRLRFRPIIMTSMAFILGILPLVVANGAGAASRHSIGTGVFGGMLAESVVAIFFTPLFFVVVQRFTNRFSIRKPTAPIPANAEPATLQPTVGGH